MTLNGNLLKISLSEQFHKCPIVIFFTGTAQSFKEVPLNIFTQLHQVLKLLDDGLKQLQCLTHFFRITLSLFSGRGVVRMEKTCPNTRASSSVGRLPKK